MLRRVLISEGADPTALESFHAHCGRMACATRAHESAELAPIAAHTMNHSLATSQRYQRATDVNAVKVAEHLRAAVASASSIPVLKPKQKPLPRPEVIPTVTRTGPVVPESGKYGCIMSDVLIYY